MFTACSSAQTGVIAVVDTDLDVPQQLALIRTRVGSSVFDFVLDDATRPLGIPFSFVVVPQDDDASRPLTIVVEALDPTRAFMFDLATETGFREGVYLRLPLFLAADCRGQMCSAVETCGLGGCQSRVVDPRTLDIVEPGREL